MRCPECDTPKTRVYDTRPAQGDPRHEATIAKGAHVWAWWEPGGFRVRRRECTACKHRFDTIEIEISDLRAGMGCLEELSAAHTVKVQDLEKRLRQLTHAADG